MAGSYHAYRALRLTLPDFAKGSAPQVHEELYLGAMQRYVGRPRPQLQSPAARRVAPPVVVAHTINRRNMPAARRPDAPHPNIELPLDFVPDPYVDYGRCLTPAGGILLTYKDIDARFRHVFFGGVAWTIFTALEIWALQDVSPFRSGWAEFGCLLTMALLNWFIVAKPVEVYRTIEVRPDCLIIEGADVFWLRHMENGWPCFRPDQDGNQILCGIYGSRLVDYLTLRRFDEFDKAPEVFAAHLQDAMTQLWASAPAH